MLNVGDIISYNTMCTEENSSIQRGMNFKLNNTLSVILMSVREGAPYQDSIQDDGKVLIYEGHDVPKRKGSNIDPKTVDQKMYTENGVLTENGKFYRAAMRYKENGAAPEKVKVYEKIKSGIWSYNGIFSLTDAWTEKSGNRKVFKFRLELIDDSKQTDKINNTDADYSRVIPTSVKVEVWKRDKGCCVKCGSNKDLHFDHIIPYSKGGSSTTAKNIQILCSKCNLSKSDKII